MEHGVQPTPRTDVDWNGIITMESKEALLDLELLDEIAVIGVDKLREIIDMYLTKTDELLVDLHTAVEVAQRMTSNT